jgi:acyl carrier protein
LPGPLTTEGMPATASDAILDEVRRLLVDVIGEDYLLDIEIDLDTSFNEDLEVESIEFVALAERLLDRYGERVDFVGWLAEMELDDIIGLTVGDLVGFIEAATTASAAGPAPATASNQGEG